MFDTLLVVSRNFISDQICWCTEPEEQQFVNLQILTYYELHRGRFKATAEKGAELNWTLSRNTAASVTVVLDHRCSVKTSFMLTCRHFVLCNYTCRVLRGSCLLTLNSSVEIDALFTFQSLI